MKTIDAPGFGSLPLTLRQLQYVVAVADTLSFRKAALLCHVSQPALSTQLAAAESALGMAVFERTSRSVQVTALGGEVVARARAVLLGVDELLAFAAQQSDPFARTLKVGVIPTIAPYLLASLTPRITALYPRLVIHWVEDKTERLVTDVEQGVLDGALVALEADLRDLESVPFMNDPFVLACAHEHPLASRHAPVVIDDLTGLDLLLLDEGHCLRDQVVSFCRPRSARELPFRATSLATLIPMVAQGKHATLLPSIAIDVENRRGDLTIRPIEDGRLMRTLGFIFRKTSISRVVFDELVRSLVGPRA
jgi:LysR family hydrogen peroxide-inducible transcriptional activator